MTVLGFTLLNEIIVGKKIFSPDLILKETDKKIIEITQRDISGGKINDGMEMSVLVFHKKTNIVEVASAGTPAYYRTEEGLHIIAPNKSGLGDTHPKLDKAFRKNVFRVKKGENFYLTTDGFQDQSGGEQNRRFTKTRLRELLWSVRDLPISEQKLVIRQSFQQWKKEQAQTDDVLLIGIKI
jgi:hypothetical protein